MLKLYNTLSRRKEVFEPISGKSVKMYTCGPTVYDRVHIGNLRAYIFEDILHRTLEYDGYRVAQVMNITDVEDKIIKRLNEEKKKSISEITEPYINAFFRDIKKLNILPAEKYPTVTGSMGEIIKLISRLEKKGFAYRGEDGSVYFSIAKFENYGRLSHIGSVSLRHGARVSSDEYDKENIGDFVLWKAAKDGEPSWDSPFGAGRPGWHIECSAMALENLGDTLDIHAGGVDLIFPHHENEIAQSEAANGVKLANLWVHNEHLLVDGRKMSKSLNNFHTLDDVVSRGSSPIGFRYLTMGAHYRSKLNFTWEALGAAENALRGLYHEIAFFGFSARSERRGKNEKNKAAEYERKFKNAINDDLNTPAALAVLWEIIGDEKLSSISKRRLLLSFDRVLGLDLKRADSLAKAPKNVVKLVKEREAARTHKQFVQADALRKDIERLGYTIEDTNQGPFLWPKQM